MSATVGERLKEDKKEAIQAFQQQAQEKWSVFEDVFYEKLMFLTKGATRAFSWASQRHVFFRWAMIGLSMLALLAFGRIFLGKEPVQVQLFLFVPVILLAASYGGGIYAAITSIIGAIVAYAANPNTTTPIIETPTGNYQSLPYVPYLLYFMVSLILVGLWKMIERRQVDLVRFKDELEVRVEERTSELRAANEELSNFCYSISHDLRAPMRNIVASSTLLTEELGGKLSTDDQELLDGIGRSAGRLSELVDDLLNHARLGNAALKPRWVNITGMMDEVGNQLRLEPWPCRTIDFNIQPNMVVTADPLLLKLAIHNLFENACKYSKMDSDLVIEVKENRTRSGAIFSIKDNGIGFDMQDATKIFEPFHRLHRDGDYPGTGIGLANVRRIIERHEGLIWVESRPGLGTTFFFTIGELKKNKVDLPETENT